ncbi:hypothetical protein QBE52_04885 [Clostridiaceae bacterium 35-E11]
MLLLKGNFRGLISRNGKNYVVVETESFDTFKVKVADEKLTRFKDIKKDQPVDMPVNANAFNSNLYLSLA